MFRKERDWSEFKEIVHGFGAMVLFIIIGTLVVMFFIQPILNGIFGECNRNVSPCHLLWLVDMLGSFLITYALFFTFYQWLDDRPIFTQKYDIEFNIEIRSVLIDETNPLEEEMVISSEKLYIFKKKMPFVPTPGSYIDDISFKITKQNGVKVEEAFVSTLNEADRRPRIIVMLEPMTFTIKSRDTEKEKEKVREEHHRWYRIYQNRGYLNREDSENKSSVKTT